MPPLSARFADKQFRSVSHEHQSALVGISMSQEYHQNPEKVAALCDLLAKQGFKEVVFMIPGELHGYNLMIDDPSLSWDMAKAKGRRMAEEWVQTNKAALEKVPHSRMIYSDDVLVYNFVELTAYLRNLRDKSSQEYDAKFAAEYNKTKGVFIAYHYSNWASRGEDFPENERKRVTQLVENYIDAELVQLRMWVEKKYPTTTLFTLKGSPQSCSTTMINILNPMTQSYLVNCFPI